VERGADRSTGFSYQTGDVRFSDSLVSHDAHGVMQRLSNGVCRRAFSSPDALAYEMTIARALAGGPSDDHDDRGSLSFLVAVTTGR
jgi:hypothetical protein